MCEFEFVDREKAIEVGLGPYANSSFSKYIPNPKPIKKHNKEDHFSSLQHRK